MKEYLIILISIMLSYCSSKHFSQEAYSNSICCDTNKIYKTCISPYLADCLLQYMESYDTIRSSWKLPPIYKIKFYLEGNDTIVSISGHKIRPIVLLPPENKGFEIKGFFYLKDNPVYVIDNKDNIGGYLYNKDKLNENVELLDKGRDSKQFENITLPIWVYKINNKVDLKIIRKEGGFIMK